VSVPDLIDQALAVCPDDHPLDVIQEMMIEKFPPIELEVFHHFAEGVYVRELRVPAGALVTSRIHKHSCVSIVSKGKAHVWTEEEGDRVVSAPACWHTVAGSRRIGYVLEDLIWLTAHACEETDPDKVLEVLTFEPPAPARFQEWLEGGVPRSALPPLPKELLE